jgi:hypothetical protein
MHSMMNVRKTNFVFAKSACRDSKNIMQTLLVEVRKRLGHENVKVHTRQK